MEQSVAVGSTSNSLSVGNPSFCKKLYTHFLALLGSRNIFVHDFKLYEFRAFLKIYLYVNLDPSINIIKTKPNVF